MVAVTAPPPAVPSTTVWSSLRCISSCIWLACESISGILSGLIILPPCGPPADCYLTRRSTTLRTSALKISFARCTRGFLRASSCTLPANGAGMAAGAPPFAAPGHDQESRGCAQPLQFLANDLFGCGVHGEAQHLLAHAGNFDAQACAVDGPRAGAEQLRGRHVTARR